MKLQTARGVRDVPSGELIIRNELVTSMKKIFENYGFNPLETPLIERLDFLSVKFGAGDSSDVAKEIFRFKDQGNRELGLRFELTLSMCRYVAMNPSLKLPFKRYEIGRVYRDGPIKLGRSREFTQCDVDIVGSKNMIADAECIKLSIDVFKALGLNAYIEVNNRKLLNGILEYAGISPLKRDEAIIVVDKLRKIGMKGVADELVKMGAKKSSADKLIALFSVLNLEGNIFDNVKEFKKLVNNDEAKEGIKELEELFSYFSDDELWNVMFNPYLARGLSYYTGTVFEGFLRDSDITSSICGGGRYDNLVKLLLGGQNNVPAVGISFGLVPIMEAIKKSKTSLKKSVTKVYIIPIGNTSKKSLEVASRLREKKIKTDIDLMGRNISKNLSFANTNEIPYVLFIGEDELKKGKLKLRDMTSGKESFVSLKEVEKEVKKIIS